MRRVAGIVLCFLLLSASEVPAGFYRWIDRDGNEFFTNDLTKVPPEYRDNTALVEPDDKRVTVTNERPRTAPSTVNEHRDKYGHGEEYWRRRAANLRLKLRDKQDEHDQVQRKIDDEDRTSRKRGKRKKTSSALGNRKMKLEREIASLTRELEVELPDEARRADAYPGWVRE